MSKVQRVGFQQVDCGKHVSDTKKRFKWTFIIEDKQHQLQFINSALSGKKTIILDSKQIHTQKNILNINFDFTFSINGHILRIIKSSQSMIKFDLLIDNRLFSQISNEKIVSASLKQQQTHDPFSDFSNLALISKQSQKIENQFGDFDFDTFNTNKSKKLINTPKDLKPSVQNIVAKQNKTIDQVNIFQTKQLEIDPLNNFINNFQKNQSDLIFQEKFQTNNYGNINNYIQLKNPLSVDSQWFQSQTVVNKNTVSDLIDINNIKIDINSKKIINNIQMVGEQVKQKIKDIAQSLI